jgi:hypothetical protein
MVQSPSVSEDPSREYALAESPNIPNFAENYMLSAFDPRADLGMWLHLGTWPEDFGIWEDFAAINLPDDILWMYAYRRTPKERRPAGSNLSFECIEPFERWRVRFDGLVSRSPREEMLAGRLRNGALERMQFDFDLTCVTPIWDAKASAASQHGTGDMREQVWAVDHYQQLYEIRGSIELDREGTVEIDTTGVRDHSRGPRGGHMDKWGGHTLIHVLYPSGKAFALQTMWLPDGSVSLDTAYVLVDGKIAYAGGIRVPRLEKVNLGGDEMELLLRSDLGEHRLHGTVIRNSYFTPQRLGMAFGADPEGPFGIFAMGHARWEWDGEIAYGLTERSNVGLGWADFQSRSD